jgi:hypothetical protein
MELSRNDQTRRKIASRLPCPGISPEKHLSTGVDRKNSLAVGTAEPSRLGSLELGGADGTLENLGEDVRRMLHLPAPRKVLYRVVKGILDVKKLRKTEQLKYFVHFRLDLQEYQITTLRFHGFQERG